MNKEPEKQQAINEWDVSSSTPAHWSFKTGPIINEQNKGLYLSVVWVLGTVSLVSLIGIIVLAFFGKDIPQALIALGSVAIGALGSLFTHSK